METKCHLPFVRPSQTARSDRLSLGPVPLRGSLNIVVDCYHIYPIPGQKKTNEIVVGFLLSSYSVRMHGQKVKAHGVCGHIVKSCHKNVHNRSIHKAMMRALLCVAW